jgi:hypothetical protein
MLATSAAEKILINRSFVETNDDPRNRAEAGDPSAHSPAVPRVQVITNPIAKFGVIRTAVVIWRVTATRSASAEMPVPTTTMPRTHIKS